MPFKDKYGRTCGFLDVKEQDKRKRFQRRYFILDKSKGLLEWYTDSPLNLDAAAQPCGSINIDYITKVDEARKMKMEFLFVINTPYRPYYVQANNQTDVEEWVEILNDASKIIVPPEAMHPQTASVSVSESEDYKENIQDGSTESSETSYTYRTEIVGNVVVKKKLKETKKSSIEEPISPPFDSVGSDFKFSMASDYSDEDVLMKGWGVKQGHMRKNWKRRYFVLKKDRFCYFKSEHDKEPLRTVFMSDILAAKSENDEASRLRDNLFLVATTDRIYYIQADSPDDMLDWINTFNNAIKTHRITSTKQPGALRGGSGLGGSTDVLDETREVAKNQADAKRFEKRSSAHTIFFTASRENIESSAGSTDSLDKSHTVEPNPKVNNQKKGIKGHRRAESAVTLLPTFTVETMSSSIKSNKLPSSSNSSGMLAFHAEDIKARPEASHLSSLVEGVADDRKRYGAPRGSRPVSENYVSCHLDPQIDLRSAVKPSLVKKKKNPGILFSLNTMLSRKQDKIQKEKSRFNH